MELNQFHFSHPLWLCLGLVIPVIWTLYFVLSQKAAPHHQLTQFIDSHLLPFLLISNTKKNNASWQRLILWTAVWTLLMLALAGPRWSFREIETFSKDQSLVVLLDLSESMNATDVNPSRLVRAKQKIEDILSLSKGVKIGLIAFAADPHMITPITEDKKNILHLLPSLETDLVHIQGSKLSPALEMASIMFEAELGKNKAIVVISDGGFEDGSAIATAKKLADKGIIIHAMGVGTEQGAPMKDHQGNVIKKEGIPIVSKLEAERFNEIANNGNGRYLEAHYSDQEVAVILEDLEKKAEAEKLMGNKDRVWEEHFYLVILLAIPMIIGWFRKGRLFAGVILLFFSLPPLEAEVADYFKNAEQLGQEAFEQQNFESAAQTFQDPYRKGIASYKAGKFSEAEEWFRQSNRSEISCSAIYNLGNALVQQNKLNEAITAYEEAIEKMPEHTKAKENLELVKKMLEEQKPPSQEQNNNNKDQQDQSKDQQKDASNTDQSSDSKNNNQEQRDQQKDASNTDQSSDSNTNEGHQNNKSDEKDQKNDALGEDEQQQDMKSSRDEEKNDTSAENLPQPQERQEQEKKESEQDSNLWLNRLNNDPKTFLKNKFYIETKKNGTTEGINPW